MVIIARSVVSGKVYKWQAALKSRGIRCMVMEPVISRFRGGAGIDPTWNLEVRAGDAEHAIQILQDVIHEE